MRNAILKYFGLVLCLIGAIAVSGGIYFGSSVIFGSSISEQSGYIIIGTVMLIVGLLMWIFIDDSGAKLSESDKNWLNDTKEKE